MSYKIALGGIHIESTTFTSYISSDSDFRIYRDQKLLDYYSWLDEEDYDIHPIPLVMARAIPGGVVSKDFFNTWLEEYLDGLKQVLPIDGILLDIHGAMSVEGMDDAEGYLIKEIRKVVGKDILISTTMDLHGNVSNDLFHNSDLITCYRTAPHIDVIKTKQRALRNLITVLDEKLEVINIKVNIPILLPGEKTSTEVEPGKTLYSKLETICEKEGILDASIWMGFPWADQPRCHSVIVITGTNKEVIEEEILQLSNYFWSIRNDFVFVGPTASMSKAIEEALQSNEKPFFISDTGDNPGAGGANDINTILREFISINPSKKVLITSLFDKVSIPIIYTYQIGDTVQTELGGRVDPKYGKPLKLEVEILRLSNDPIAGRCAVLRVNNVDVVVTENRYQYGTLKAFNNAGITSFDEYDIIVVKMGYLEPDLSAAAKGWVMALTEGAVSQDLKNINYKKLIRPIYPLDIFEFKPKLIINNKSTYISK